MGRPIRAQKKGKSLRYRSPSHRHKGVSEYRTGEVIVHDIIHSPGKNAPLLSVVADGKRSLMLAPEGISTGETLKVGANEIKPGNVVALASIPEGVPIFNVEGRPGDNGRYARTGGTSAFIISRGNTVVVRLPSKKLKEFSPDCRATIGIVAGGGRGDKPFVKAGNKYHYMRSRGKLYPFSSADKMNAVDHPFGGRTKKGIPMTTSRHAVPGAKVGSIAARRTGRRKK